jgi:hypothetical protein
MSSCDDPRHSIKGGSRCQRHDRTSSSRAIAALKKLGAWPMLQPILLNERISFRSNTAGCRWPGAPRYGADRDRQKQSGKCHLVDADTINIHACSSRSPILIPRRTKLRHRFFARRGGAVRHARFRRPDRGDRPEPAQLRRRTGRAVVIDTADDLAVGDHVIVFVLPLAVGAGGGCALRVRLVILLRGASSTEGRALRGR